jgi:hypothetical protein
MMHVGSCDTLIPKLRVLRGIVGFFGLGRIAAMYRMTFDELPSTMLAPPPLIRHVDFPKMHRQPDPILQRSRIAI